jgi:hypothetical protein
VCVCVCVCVWWGGGGDEDVSSILTFETPKQSGEEK